MFENLQEKLQRAFKSLRGEARLSEENIGEALREIRLALLEADVNFKVVKDLIDRIQAKAVGQEVLTALSPGEQVIKIVDDELMGEMQSLKKLLNPSEILFVADAMTGQDAVRSADEFHKKLSLTGIILTKMDGDARGGAALSIRQVTGQPIKFIGVGEKYDALEPFHPDRIVSRILGMGDILSLIEKAEQNVDKKKAEEMASRALAGDGFSLEDFRDQLRQVKKMGSLQSLMGMLPSIGPFAGLQKHADKVDEKQLNRDRKSTRLNSSHS